MDPCCWFYIWIYIVQTYCVNLNKWHDDVCGSWAADPAVEASYVSEQQKIKSENIVFQLVSIIIFTCSKRQLINSILETIDLYILPTTWFNLYKKQLFQETNDLFKLIELLTYYLETILINLYCLRVRKCIDSSGT